MSGFQYKTEYLFKPSSSRYKYDPHPKETRYVVCTAQREYWYLYIVFEIKHLIDHETRL